MDEYKGYTEYNTVCYSTEEYTELVKQVKEHGGQVAHTFAMRNGRGISVQYRIPKEPKALI